MTHCYPPGCMFADYLRTAVGLLLTLGPIIFLSLPPVTLAILLSMAAMFAVFGLQAWRRQGSRVDVTHEFITAHPGGPRLAWSEITNMSLAYFSTWRDGRKGWMELKLSVGRQSIRFDSRLDGFVDIAERAAGAVDAQRVILDPATARNMSMLGVGDMTATSVTRWEGT